MIADVVISVFVEAIDVGRFQALVHLEIKDDKAEAIGRFPLRRSKSEPRDIGIS